jgi:hypothetical protein
MLGTGSRPSGDPQVVHGCNASVETRGLGAKAADSCAAGDPSNLLETNQSHTQSHSQTQPHSTAVHHAKATAKPAVIAGPGDSVLCSASVACPQLRCAIAEWRMVPSGGAEVRSNSKRVDNTLSSGALVGDDAGRKRYRGFCVTSAPLGARVTLPVDLSTPEIRPDPHSLWRPYGGSPSWLRQKRRLNRVFRHTTSRNETKHTYLHWRYNSWPINSTKTSAERRWMRMAVGLCVYSSQA